MRSFQTGWAHRALRSRLIAAMTGACLCTFVLVTAIPGVASAQTIQEVTVHYGDLDLTTGAGAKTLNRRLEIAVRKVCSRAPGIEVITGYSTAKACRAKKWQEIGLQSNAVANGE